MAEHNALVVTFTDRAKAFEAFSSLKNEAASDRLVLRGAHLVTRDEHGRLTVPEGVETESDAGIWGGGLVGLLIGILGGTVVPRPAEAVLAEMESAEDAYREAQKEADRRAREERKAERKQNFEERKESLKEKLGIG